MGCTWCQPVKEQAPLNCCASGAPQPPPADPAPPPGSNHAPGRVQVLHSLRSRQLLPAHTPPEGPPLQPHADIETGVSRNLGNSNSLRRRRRQQPPVLVQQLLQEESTQERGWVYAAYLAWASSSILLHRTCLHSPMLAGPRRARTRNRQAAMQRGWKVNGIEGRPAWKY
eukprot:1138709-Pelagomonas_calceolata.AAC.2